MGSMVATPWATSIGVNIYEGDATKLFTDADPALYQAKNGGCVVAFEPKTSMG